jgi:hypothetical protein
MDVAIVVLVRQGRPDVEDAPKPHPDLPLVGVLVQWDRGKRGDPTAARPKGGVDQFQVESECKVPERP